MTILVVGNMGYVGPVLVQHLRQAYPQAVLIGYDAGLFAHCLLGAVALPEIILDRQLFGDVRHLDKAVLEGVDVVVNLAAISNDPIGNRFEDATLGINYKAAVELAAKAKLAGVRSYVFASSCSVYGCAEEGAKTESSMLDPLTAYARSKVMAEKELIPMADERFTVTCLRFATACGMSDRLRLDLVLNDFVAGALTQKKIVVMSDGTPWRPLINVKDMARAMEWAIGRSAKNGGKGLIVNVGSNEWNCQVKDLAHAVAAAIPDVDVSINANAPPDKRSYRVNYDLFKELAPGFQPRFDLKSTILDMTDGLQKAGFQNAAYRESQYMRLNVISRFREQGLLDQKLGMTFTGAREKVLQIQPA
ncbi:NAD-dependent epimerase/dehydratase family protein [Nitrospira sp. BLG_1]|uniref:NAD-dependent epimerase/dehydratase family protein n=1 Tax=Nitrospira sp. BLG_1 TaxID=3395883 RepID=UPI0039BD2767